jgi:hypothetical protein
MCQLHARVCVYQANFLRPRCRAVRSRRSFASCGRGGAYLQKALPPSADASCRDMPRGPWQSFVPADCLRPRVIPPSRCHAVDKRAGRCHTIPSCYQQTFSRCLSISLILVKRLAVKLLSIVRTHVRAHLQAPRRLSRPATQFPSRHKRRIGQEICRRRQNSLCGQRRSSL